MAQNIHIHLPALLKKPVAWKDTREQKFGLPVYTEEEIKQKIRNGEWEAETDVVKGKRVELRKGSKRFQAYVKDAGGVEYLTANDILEKYGPTFLARVQRQKEATAPDGSIIKVDGRGFTRVN